MSLDILLGRHKQHDRDIQILVQLVISLNRKVDKVMATQAEHAAALAALSTQLVGLQTELQTDVAVLTQALANQGGTTAEVDAALAALQGRVATLDTQVKAVDALATPPAPTP